MSIDPAPSCERGGVDVEHGDSYCSTTGIISVGASDPA